MKVSTRHWHWYILLSVHAKNRGRGVKLSLIKLFIVMLVIPVTGICQTKDFDLPEYLNGRNPQKVGDWYLHFLGHAAWTSSDNGQKSKNYLGLNCSRIVDIEKSVVGLKLILNRIPKSRDKIVLKFKGTEFLTHQFEYDAKNQRQLVDMEAAIQKVLATPGVMEAAIIINGETVDELSMNGAADVFFKVLTKCGAIKVNNPKNSNLEPGLPDWLETQKGETVGDWVIHKNRKATWVEGKKEEPLRSAIILQCLKAPGASKPSVVVGVSFENPLSPERNFLLKIGTSKFPLSAIELQGPKGRVVVDLEPLLDTLIRSKKTMRAELIEIGGKNDYSYSLNGASGALFTVLTDCGAVKTN